VLPAGCGAELDPATWRRPAIFDALQQIGSLPEQEMYRTFNMGIGLVLTTSPYYADSVMAQLRREGEQPVRIGEVVAGSGEVRFK
jgi:phosphoribosylformylglycinamidine cyclo-ligase